jgi:NDP-sugar pyrophosphorylase family protein/aminoglycoside/choline kinase family phosphotransferase
MEEGPSLNLFIASAGLGTRLRPATGTFPKPLLPLAGVPLVERLLHSVQASLQIRDFAMNLHYKPELFQQWAQGLMPELLRPVFFYEEDLLGTGGAIYNARAFFRRGTCLLVNGDILTDFDWAAFAAHHRRCGNLVTLAVQDRSHERRVGVDAEGQLLCIDPEMKTPGVHRWLGYACAAIYEPDFLAYLPEGESHVPPYWVAAAQQTGRVGTFDIGSSPWLDLGNADCYAEGVFSCVSGAERFFAEPLNIPWDTRIIGRCVIEKNVKIGSNVELCDAILLPGTRVGDGERLRSMIAGPDFRESFSLPAAETLPANDKTVLSGSDRVYRHAAEGMLLEYTASESLIERQIALTEILRRNQLPVPRIISHNPAKRQMLLDDLGDESLRVWCRSRSVDEITPMLKNVLDRLIDFQWTDTSGSPYPRDKPFDKTVLLWESSYFMERCVYRVFGLNEFGRPLADALGQEFERLAERVACFPRNLMHRDFQSSNVMMYQGAPWFIDFQAARHGPCFYDAASMIGDPYLCLPRPLRAELETYYLTSAGERLAMTAGEARSALVLCGMQRHMQALGAYGFISSIRGKKEFLQYIPPALNLLAEEVTALQAEFPALNQLVVKLEAISNHKSTEAQRFEPNH